MKKKISWLEVIITLIVVLVIVKGHQYLNKLEKISEVTPAPTVKPVEDTSSEWNHALLMAVAEKYGSTDEEKYGNKILIIIAETLFILNNNINAARPLLPSDYFLYSEETSAEEIVRIADDTFIECKKAAERNIVRLTEVKTTLEEITVPEGYEEINKNLISCYDKITEGIKMSIEKAKEKDIEGIIASQDIIDECTPYRNKAAMDFNKKEYKPSEEFLYVVEEDILGVKIYWQNP